MICTEDEAKEKLCPERCYGPLDVLCVGTRCMAWRTIEEITVSGDHKNFGGERTVIRGYCGLAELRRRVF